jgi:PAS domain S-box-containing protein
MPILKIDRLNKFINKVKTKRLIPKLERMNIKPFLPAINTTLFFGLGFFLFALIVLFINWYFSLPVNQAYMINKQLTVTEKHLIELKALKSDFMLDFDKEDNLFVSGNSSIENEVNSLIEGIHQDIAFYKSFPRVNKIPAFPEAAKEFSTALSSLETNLDKFLLTLREKGNEQEGLVSRWQNLSKQMQATNPSNETILKELNQMKQLELNYLLHSDKKILEDISVIAEKIRSQLLPEKSGIAIADLDNYMQLTGNLIALEKRIRGNNEQGIIVGVEESTNELLTSFENLKELVTITLKKIQFRSKLSGYIIITVFTVGCILLLITITKMMVTLPLRQIGVITGKLATGEVSGDEIISKALPEVQIIKDNIEKLASALRDKLAFTRSINKGKLNVQLAFSGDKDILGKELIILQNTLSETAQIQEKSNQENERRRYINEGLAKFADLLRAKSNDIHTLGDVFIQEVVKYLNAIQGGFFLYDDSEKNQPVLRLISAFAYNRKKYMQKTLALGEGLVGTCAIEKQTMNLTEIPSGYIEITSGLGDTKPDNLILVPVLHEDELIGVIEIASLSKYKDHEILFAEEVAKSLGSTIIYTRNSQRTTELLAKSQKQAIEMTEQEEEMRQNLEELKATQEESNRREEEFKGIAEAIENTLFVIEYDLEGIIRSVSNNFCTFLNQSAEVITGKYHQEIFKGTLVPDSQFWDAIQKKNHMEYFETVKVRRKNYRLKEHFTKILDRGGIAVKYINFVADITNEHAQ